MLLRIRKSLFESSLAIWAKEKQGNSKTMIVFYMTPALSSQLILSVSLPPQLFLTKSVEQKYMQGLWLTSKVMASKNIYYFS